MSLLNAKFIACCWLSMYKLFKQQLKISRFLLIYIPAVYFFLFLIKLYYWPGHTFLFQLPTIDIPIVHGIGKNTVQIKAISKLSMSDYFYILLVISIISAFISKAGNFILQLIKLNKLICNTICIKRCDNLSIMVSDAIHSPCCFSFLRRSYIVIAKELLEDHINYQLALKHELQHIRQKDTSWIYIFEIFKVVFYFNPFIHFWHKYNIELQELACDEALIKEKSVCSKDYAQCLLASAEQAINKRFLTQEMFSAAVGFFHSKQSLTSRRIVMLFQYQKTLNRRGFVFFISALMSLIIATTSYAVGVTSYQNKKALDKAVFTNNYIVKWSHEAVLKSFTYNYTNYKKSLEGASRYFTKEGWTNFMTALKGSDNIDAVVTRKLNVFAVSNNAPKIIQQGVENGKYTWHVKIPITVIYQGAQEQKPENVQVELLIIRTNETANEIGISQYNVTLPEHK